MSGSSSRRRSPRRRAPPGSPTGARVAVQRRFELRDIEPDLTSDSHKLVIRERFAVLTSLRVEQRVMVLPELALVSRRLGGLRGVPRLLADERKHPELDLHLALLHVV